MNGDKINVLNHGYVRLVDSMGSDLDIVRAARHSFDAAWRSGEDEKGDEKLLRYLLKNGHTSPFEMVEFKFEVKAPIFVFRQWHRHRMWNYNEVSARYTELPDEWYVPEEKQIGVQSQDNKQSRDLSDNDYAEVIHDSIDEANQRSYSTYKLLVEHGCPRELARSVLPVGMYSAMFAKIDLHNLLHFLKLRDHSHAQYEIQVYARAIRDLITPIVPVTMELWKDLRAQGTL